MVSFHCFPWKLRREIEIGRGKQIKRSSWSVIYFLILSSLAAKIPGARFATRLANTTSSSLILHSSAELTNLRNPTLPLMILR